MKLEEYNKQAEELESDVIEIVKLLKSNIQSTPKFLNGVLIGFYAFDDLLCALSDLRYKIAKAFSILFALEGRAADERTALFMKRLISGELAIPALEKKYDEKKTS